MASQRKFWESQAAIPKNLFELKAKLLCEGFNAGEEAMRLFQKQNPSSALRGGLSSGGKMKIFRDGWLPSECNDSLFVNAPYYIRRQVPLKVSSGFDGEGSISISQGGYVLGKGEALKAPKWYGERVEGFRITQILTAHNRQLATAVYEGCALFSTGEQCKFCVIDRSLSEKDSRLVVKSPELMLSALEKIPLGDYGGITINGGTTFSPDRGIGYIEPVAKAISRRYKGFPIAVEITPPADLMWIDRLVDAGVDSLMMNLETWDVDMRRALLPGKDKYCPKESYLAAFERAASLLGRGKASTCFVVGTEPLQSLMEGISSVINLGVIPSPLAGRFFEDIPDYPFAPRVDWREFVQAIAFARDETIKAGLRTLDKAGCVACGMCDLIKDAAIAGGQLKVV